MNDTELAQRLRETVTRGWADDKNCNKIVDNVLVESIVHELMLSLSPDCHPSRALPPGSVFA